MEVASFRRKVAGAIAAVALLTSSTGAYATPTPASPSVGMDPLVALSVFASDASRAALCGAAVTVAAGVAKAARFR